MYKSFQRDWRRLRNAEPGSRFQEAFEARQRRRRSAWSAVRLLKIVAGVTLTLVGPVVGMVPGPGGLVVFALGLALIATEVRPAARLFDWLELELRAGWASAWRGWRSLALTHRLAIVVCLVAVCTLVAYFAFTFAASHSIFGRPAIIDMESALESPAL